MTYVRYSYYIAVCSVLLFRALPAGAANRIEAPNWDRDLALQTAVLNSNEDQLNEWFKMLRTGEGTKLLRLVGTFGSATQIPAPARDRQLFLFTTGLAGFPAASIPPKIVDFLEAYVPQTLVPHDEDVSHGIPLFNVTAAAQGLKHGMERQRGELRSAELLQTGPDAWIAAYLSATVPARAGFLDALDGATDQQMGELGKTALRSMGEWPELFKPAARAALATADQTAMEKLMIIGRGDGLASMMLAARGQLGRGMQAQLLLAAIQSAPAENAALVIGTLAPGLEAFPEVTESLFDLLEDSALGSSAALALSRHTDPAVRERLGALALEKSAFARRARLALELSSAGTVQ